MGKGFIRYSYAELHRVLQLPEDYEIYGIEHQPLQQSVFVLVRHDGIPPVGEDSHVNPVHVYYRWRTDLDGTEWRQLAEVK